MPGTKSPPSAMTGDDHRAALETTGMTAKAASGPTGQSPQAALPIDSGRLIEGVEQVRRDGPQSAVTRRASVSFTTESSPLGEAATEGNLRFC